MVAYIVARETPLFALRTVIVEGAPPAVERDVRAALAPDLGSSLVSLDREGVRRRLEALPTVVSASEDRDFPHTLHIVVAPEVPAAVLRRGAGSWLVSGRGRLMRRLEPGSSRELPRIWVTGSAVPVGAFLHGTPARVAAAAAVAGRSPLAGRVASARFEEGRLTFVLRSGLELRLGRADDVALKLAVARSVLASVQGGAGAGSYLDLTVPERPVGRFNSQVAS